MANVLPPSPMGGLSGQPSPGFGAIQAPGMAPRNGLPPPVGVPMPAPVNDVPAHVHALPPPPGAPGEVSFQPFQPQAPQAFAGLVPAPFVQAPQMPFQSPLHAQPVGPGGSGAPAPPYPPPNGVLQSLAPAHLGVSPMPPMMSAPVAAPPAMPLPPAPVTVASVSSIAAQATAPIVAPPIYFTKVVSERRFPYRAPSAAIQGALRALPQWPALPPSAMVPPEVDLRAFFGPARDAGSANHPAHAVADLADAVFAAAVGARPPAGFSAAYLAARASGTSVGELFAVLAQYGACSESYFPSAAFGDARHLLAKVAEEKGATDLVADHIAERDAWLADADVAASFFALQPYRVDWLDPQGRVDAARVKSVMAGSGVPVVVALVAPANFASPTESASSVTSVAPDTLRPVASRLGAPPAPGTADGLLGRHAVVLCGYTAGAAGGWIVRNVWGPEWGDEGYAIMPYGWETMWLEAWTAVYAGRGM